MTSTSISEQLLIEPRATIWLSHASRIGLISPLPEGARAVEEPEQARVAVVFADHSGALRETLITKGRRLAQADTIWITYPRPHLTDLTCDTLWPMLEKLGLRPVTRVAVVAVDEVWSAMQFRRMRDGEAPFTGEW